MERDQASECACVCVIGEERESERENARQGNDSVKRRRCFVQHVLLNPPPLSLSLSLALALSPSLSL